MGIVNAIGCDLSVPFDGVLLSSLNASANTRSVGIALCTFFKILASSRC